MLLHLPTTFLHPSLSTNILAHAVGDLGMAAPANHLPLLPLPLPTTALLHPPVQVFNGQHYNVKADVFSFAMAMYELVHRRLILSTILEKHFGSSFEEKELALYEYASAVATQGYR